jgi:hypothetical protein
VRFPVFANQLSCVATKVEGPDLVQKPIYLIAHAAIGLLQLSLYKPLEEAAAGLLVGASLSVEPLEQVV